MKKWTILLIVLATALLYGCEATTRYRVLSFFFDGVPDPEEQSVVEGGQAAGGGKPGSGAVIWYQHGPYAAKMCEGCHMRGSNTLVAPKEELCLRCHEIKMDKKWVHGPLLSGGCGVCHNHHGSPNRFFLVSASDNFCFYCHDEKAIREKGPHKDSDMGCTSCHDAHMSDKRYLLK